MDQHAPRGLDRAALVEHRRRLAQADEARAFAKAAGSAQDARSGTNSGDALSTGSTAELSPIAHRILAAALPSSASTATMTALPPPDFARIIFRYDLGFHETYKNEYMGSADAPVTVMRGGASGQAASADAAGKKGNALEGDARVAAQIGKLFLAIADNKESAKMGSATTGENGKSAKAKKRPREAKGESDMHVVGLAPSGGIERPQASNPSHTNGSEAPAADAIDDDDDIFGDAGRDYVLTLERKPQAFVPVSASNDERGGHDDETGRKTHMDEDDDMFGAPRTEDADGGKDTAQAPSAKRVKLDNLFSNPIDLTSGISKSDISAAGAAVFENMKRTDAEQRESRSGAGAAAGARGEADSVGEGDKMDGELSARGLRFGSLSGLTAIDRDNDDLDLDYGGDEHHLMAMRGEKKKKWRRKKDKDKDNGV